jgi:ubiquinone/menaquinone biosynthesis C-methylase UbiE
MENHLQRKHPILRRIISEACMHDRVFKHSHAHKLEDPERLKWLPPAQVLARLPLREGLRVADVGAGTGYFTIPFGHAVGTSGHVFAVDLQSEMLGLLRLKLDRPDTPRNISLHQGPASNLPLSDRSVDLVFYANVWHEIDDADSAFREAVRIAGPSGRIAILDWRHDQPSPPGPPQEHRIAEDAVAKFLDDRGCRDITRNAPAPFSYMVSASLY